MTTIKNNLQAIQKRIQVAAHAAKRDPADISLLAVSKTWPASVILAAWQAGQKAFAENYVQEAMKKIHELSDYAIEWHFIGPIQSNKTRLIAEHFSWVHSVDSLKNAQRLSQYRPETLPPLQVCIQVNISGETSKHGVSPENLEILAAQVKGLPKIKLRGLMTIPKATQDSYQQQQAFRRLRELKEKLNGSMLDTLSMGMSGDFEAAIQEGATIVRLGTAIFGERSKGQ